MVYQVIEELERQLGIISVLGIELIWIRRFRRLQKLQIVAGLVLRHNVDRREKTLLVVLLDLLLAKVFWHCGNRLRQLGIPQ